jgi:choice-of-anchor B domain-containing protein
MKQLLHTFVFCILSISAFAQPNLNITLQSKIDWNEGGSGCWGHTDSRNIEYAIVGTRKSIRILSLEDPKNPIERLNIPGAQNNWREARAFGNFIYVTTESTVDGLTIIDISKGPDSMVFKRWKPLIPNGSNETMVKAHSINMDELGFMYINGTNLSNRGVLIFDTKPDGNNPTFMSQVGAPTYTHDCFATKKILYTADLSNSVGVYDVTDKTKPIFLNRFTTSRKFTHNMWTSPDEKYLYTTDEVPGSTIDVYDVSDPLNVKLISRYQNQDSRTDKVIAHNIYNVGNYAITSWYTDGVLITDMSRPDNVVKVGSYDTFFNEAGLSPSEQWFSGCWGVYPFLKSGNLVLSDIQTGMYIVKPTLTRASYLEGRVLLRTPDGTLTPLQGATVTIVNQYKNFGGSNQIGEYKTGVATPGKYKVVMNHPNYKMDSVELNLTSGNVVNYDFIIGVAKTSGKVVDNKNNPIANANIIIGQDLSAKDNLVVKSNALGVFDAFIGSGLDYQVGVAAWGYLHKSGSINSTKPNVIKLDRGYQDDFFADLDWKNTTKATAGNWVRGMPSLTTNGGATSNPGADDDSDNGNQAYITGNNGGAAGDDDVDGGSTILESPIMDFSNADTAVLSYSKWFYAGGGTGAPNDTMKIFLSNGVTKLLIETINTNTNIWFPTEQTVTRQSIAFNANMKLIIEVGDSNPGHLVEGGFDAFKAELFGKLLNTYTANQIPVKIFPNPTTNEVNIEIENFHSVDLFDLQGRKVMESNVSKLQLSSLSNGLYLAKIKLENGQVQSVNIIKQ